MTDATFKIILFEPFMQGGVDELMDSISDEFEETIYGPDSKKLTELAAIPGRVYWAAMHGEKLAGTVGIAMISNNNAVLKGMMLHKDYRGKQYGLSSLMLSRAELEAVKIGAKTMYLGTMTQMQGAQRFYEKNGYERIGEQKLPADFPSNPVDKVFYRKELKCVL
jgi:GNAT superfamily N-acetyltransferase